MLFSSRKNQKKNVMQHSTQIVVDLIFVLCIDMQLIAIKAGIRLKKMHTKNIYFMNVLGLL